MESIITSLLGLFVGLVMGLTGAGGGILSVPLLIHFLNLNVAEAGPIALMAIAVSAGIGALLAHRKKLLRYKAALLIGSSGLATAPIGLWLAHQIPNQPLLVIFGMILIALAIRYFHEAQQELWHKQPIANADAICLLNTDTGKLAWTKPCFLIMLSIGAISGFLSGLLGVGGGFVIVPALKKYTNLTSNAIVSSSLGVMTIIALGSVAISGVAGKLNWTIGIFFSIGTSMGLLMSRAISQQLNQARIQQLFSAFIFVVGIYMCCKPFFNL